MTEQQKHSIVRAATIVGIFTLLSRLVGLLRDRLFAGTFGAGNTLDAYYTAFRLPDLFFNLLVLGTLSVAFIPVFTEYLVKDKEEANRIANTIVNLAFLVMSVLMLLFLPFVPVATHLIAPGFDSQKAQITITLTRIFLLSPIIFTVSSIFSSILNSVKRFLITSFAPILYNLGIIFGIKYLYPHFGIKGLAYGVIAGAMAHLLIQFWGAIRTSYKYRPILELKNPGVIKIAKLFVPRIFGIDNSQFSLLIASIIGSSLASGSIAIFNLANNLQAVPIGIFALSFAVAAFPNLSESFARKDDAEFNHVLVKTIINVLFFVIPISLAMIMMRGQIVRLIYGEGQFNWNDTKLTANTLGIFVASIFAQSLIPLFSRAFYARHNTIIPVTVGLLSLAFNLAVSFVLGRHFGVLGLTAGFSIASILNMFVLYFMLRARLTHIDDNFLAYSILKIIFASLLMAAGIYIVLYYIGTNLQLEKGYQVLIQTAAATAVGSGIFLAASFLMDMEQTTFVFRFLKEKIWNKMLLR